MRKVVIFISGLIVGAGIIILINNRDGVKLNNTFENKEEVIEESKVQKNFTVLQNNDQLVTTLMNPYLELNTLWAGDYFGYFYLNEKNEIKDIKDDVKLYIAIHTFKDIFKNYQSGQMIVLDANQVDNKMKELFGNIKYVHTSLSSDGCSYANFKYNSTNNTYSQEGLSCGGTILPYYDLEVLKAIKYNDRIEIEVVVGYFEITELGVNNKVTIYDNHKDKHILAQNITQNESNLIDNQDKLNHYIYTFKKDNNNYYLEKVNRVGSI